MASGAQHYGYAEALLALGDVMRPEDYDEGDYNATRLAVAAEAQVHATLALAAATAMAGLDGIAQNGEDFYDAEEDAAQNWAKATRPSKAGA